MSAREKADIRNQKAREKRAREKAEAEEEDSDQDRNGKEVPVKKRKVKKAKPRKKGGPKTDIFELSSDEDEADPPKKFTVYIEIEGPKPLPTTSRSKAPSLPALTIKKGPFFHHTNESFLVLRQRIAAETPCNVKLLVLSQLQWKFDKPLGGPRWLMTNDAGYDAMISSVSEKRGDCVIFVYMPPPEKDVVSN